MSLFSFRDAQYETTQTIPIAYNFTFEKYLQFVHPCDWISAQILLWMRIFDKYSSTLNLNSTILKLFGKTVIFQGLKAKICHILGFSRSTVQVVPSDGREGRQFCSVKTWLGCLCTSSGLGLRSKFGPPQCQCCSCGGYSQTPHSASPRELWVSPGPDGNAHNAHWHRKRGRKPGVRR